MTITVLTEAQREAVEYVTRKSRKDSVAVYSNLKEKVISLGFTETDLKRLALLYREQGFVGWLEIVIGWKCHRRMSEILLGLLMN